MARPARTTTAPGDAHAEARRGSPRRARTGSWRISRSPGGHPLPPGARKGCVSFSQWSRGWVEVSTHGGGTAAGAAQSGRCCKHVWSWLWLKTRHSAAWRLPAVDAWLRGVGNAASLHHSPDGDPDEDPVPFPDPAACRPRRWCCHKTPPPPAARRPTAAPRQPPRRPRRRLRPPAATTMRPAPMASPAPTAPPRSRHS